MDLKDIYKVNQKRVESFTVGGEHTAYHIGSGRSRVLSTPSLISFLEQVAHRLLEKDLPEGTLSVGIRVDIKHLAATPVHTVVRVQAEITEITGRRIAFQVQAWDEQEKIGEGEHWRAVVDKARFQKAVAAKKDAL